MARLFSRPPAGPSAVVLGADGLLLEYGDGVHFVPARRLIGVEQSERIKICIKARGRAHLWIQMKREADAEGFCRAAEPALAPPLSAGSGDARVLIDKTPGPLPEKIAALVAALGGPHDYRQRALSHSDVAHVVGDGRASPKQRLVAAAALQRVDDQGASSALVAAMQASANVPLRDALHALAEERHIDPVLLAAADRWHRGRAQEA
jgi:hypothetical protein